LYILFIDKVETRALEMKKKQLDYFKNLLNERLEVLLNEATKTMADMTDEKETFPDPTDRASLESDRNFLLRIRDRERKLILKIREALSRIENGTYGICEECGEEISEQRLNVRPVTTLCIECKKDQEAEEKQRGA
jgi:DnaK suppressor protein